MSDEQAKGTKNSYKKDAIKLKQMVIVNRTGHIKTTGFACYSVMIDLK